VTTRAKARGIFNLGKGFGRISSRHIFDHLGEGLEFFPKNGLRGAWWVVTFDTGHEVVFRGFPGVIVRLHDMTGVAKRRTLRIFGDPE